MDENAETNEAPAVHLIEMTVDIVSAYVSNNPVPLPDLSMLIASIHAALTGLGKGAATGTSVVEKLTSAQIRKSITPDGLTSFEDGKSYKTLRRHLTIRGLTAEAYREKWGLPRDYPMTAASYSEQRSKLAQSIGLGHQRRKAAQMATPKDEAISEKPKLAGRPRKI